MSNIQMILSDIDVLLNRKNNIKLLLTLINEDKSFNTKGIDNLINEEKKYLTPFNFILKDNSSFIDPVLQFIFPFFVKLGLINKFGLYTEFISKILTEQDITTKSNIKNEFYTKYMQKTYRHDGSWVINRDLKSLFSNLLDNLIFEHGNIEDKILSTMIYYAPKENSYETIGNDSEKCFISNGNNIYESFCKSSFIYGDNNTMRYIKITMPKFLFIEVLHPIPIEIPQIMDLIKFKYMLIGVAGLCRSYTKRNNKWYLINDCAPPIIHDEKSFKFFENNNLSLVNINKIDDYPRIIGYESSTDNQGEMTIDTTNENDRNLIKNIFKTKFNIDVN